MDSFHSVLLLPPDRFIPAPQNYAPAYDRASRIGPQLKSPTPAACPAFYRTKAAHVYVRVCMRRLYMKEAEREAREIFYRCTALSRALRGGAPQVETVPLVLFAQASRGSGRDPSPARSGWSQSGGDRLDLGVVVEHLLAHLATPAGLLITAEWQ